MPAHREEEIRNGRAGRVAADSCRSDLDGTDSECLEGTPQARGMPIERRVEIELQIYSQLNSVRAGRNNDVATIQLEKHTLDAVKFGSVRVPVNELKKTWFLFSIHHSMSRTEKWISL